MKVFSVLTTTRADFGIFRPLIHRIKNHPEMKLDLIVSGTHLSQRFGKTFTEIERSGFSISKMIDIFNDQISVNQLHSSSILQNELAAYLSNTKPDYLLLLGDRFETLSAGFAATFADVPIIHLHGGELTLGAKDELYRHALTKLAKIHLVSTNEHKERVVQMGEAPERVFNIGALGLDQSLSESSLSRDQLSLDLNVDLSRPTVLLTFHPETLSGLSTKEQIENVTSALDRFPDLQVVGTLPNADQGFEAVEYALRNWAESSKGRVHLFSSLGHHRYTSLLRHVKFVIGNSSSGIIEAPSFSIPTINIGDRQLGRAAARSVIHVPNELNAIANAIATLRSNSNQLAAEHFLNPYGDQNASLRAIQVLESLPAKASLKKYFYDLP